MDSKIKFYLTLSIITVTLLFVTVYNGVSNGQRKSAVGNQTTEGSSND